MIDLDITGVRFDTTEKVKKYVTKKLGKLDRYLPRNGRSGAHGRVVLSEEDGKAKNRFTCEVTLTFPHGVVTAIEATINIYAAIDIVEQKAKTQLLKHKDKVQHNRKAQRTGRLLKHLRARGGSKDDE